MSSIGTYAAEQKSCFFLLFVGPFCAAAMAKIIEENPFDMVVFHPSDESMHGSKPCMINCTGAMFHTFDMVAKRLPRKIRSRVKMAEFRWKF